MAYKLIKTFGIQRSGNHAIINWILGLSGDKTLFLNNRKVGRSLFKIVSPCSVPYGVKAQGIVINGTSYVNNNLINDFTNNCDTLVVGFENFDLKWYDKKLINFNIVSSFGAPQEEITVIIARSPANNIASLLKMRDAPAAFNVKQKIAYQYFYCVFKSFLSRYIAYLLKPSLWLHIRRVIGLRSSIDTLHKKKSVKEIISLWPTYAKVFNGSLDLGSGKVLTIYFDEWVGNKLYRDSIASKLGYVNKDKYFSFHSDAGGGSSFGNNNTNLDSAIYKNRSRDTDPKSKLSIKTILSQIPEIEKEFLLFNNKQYN